jgi:hypothetical protein
MRAAAMANDENVQQPGGGDGAAGGKKKIPVTVEADHLARLASSKRPTIALAELIWNALDADAKVIRVEIDRNQMGSIDAIRVEDDGLGMTAQDVENYFGKLGGSWKAHKAKTPAQRLLHGKLGEGRFRAFGLGSNVQWVTRTGEKGAEAELIVEGSRSTKEFTITVPTSRMRAKRGTSVTVTNVELKLPGLMDGTSDGIIEELNEHFALYLRRYPGISISVDGRPVDPDESIIADREYDLTVEMPGGGIIKPKLTIIEWATDADRALSLCDENGFTLFDLKVEARLPGYSFTAYVCSPAIRQLNESNELALGEMHGGVRAIASAARDKIKEHYRQIRALEAKGRVAAWKKEAIYPYPGDSTTKVEVVERQVFEVCAASVEMLAPEFHKADQRTKALTFRLLRQAVEKSPAELQTILTEVLGLPSQRQVQLAKLLQKTTLSAIINASSIIAGRLEFIQGLESILFDQELKNAIKERTQLHKIVERNTWLFGEEFHLTVSDEGLTRCLQRHVELTTGKKAKKIKPVKTVTGNPLVVDLFLSRRIPLPGDQRQHLVVELKRPSVQIDLDVIAQVKKYATSVSKDERFRESRVSWSFWAISNAMDDLAKDDASQADRPLGVVSTRNKDIPYTIWVKTWGQLLDECKGRLEFFREKLEYQANHESGRKYLRDVYEKLLPSMRDVGSGDIAVDAAKDPVVPPSETITTGEFEAIEAEAGGSFAVLSEEESANVETEPDDSEEEQEK